MFHKKAVPDEKESVKFLMLVLLYVQCISDFLEVQK